jgi:hypothetical protein
VKSTVNVESGSDLLLEFGEWIKYKRQSESLRVTHRGEVMVMISCAWAIKGPGGTVVDAGDVHEREPWQGDHTVLEGLTVREVGLIGHLNNLVLVFEHGFELQAFSEVGQQPDNWIVVGPSGEEIGVDSDGRLHANSQGSGAATTT